MFKPEVLQGGKGEQGRFVCPFCGATFDNRRGKDSLEAHWIESAQCSNNRNVNNQTQTKYNVEDET